MCQRNFAGLWIAAAANQCHITNGMVRRTIRPFRNQCGILRQLARHTMDLCCLQCFLQTQWRQYGWQPFCQHGFTCTRRTNQYRIVPACCCNLQGTFNIFLSFYITKINFKFILCMANSSLVFTIVVLIEFSSLKKSITSFICHTPYTFKLFTMPLPVHFVWELSIL